MKLVTSRKGLFFLAVLSGAVLSLAWPSAGFAPLLFVAFVPLLFAGTNGRINNIALKGKLVFLLAYSTFFTFNILTTWWVKYASFFGAVAAIICNALFMALVFTLFHHTRRRFGNRIGYLSLISYWVAFEYLHMNWDLSWPWLTIGNGFAGWVKLIQWYEYTGVLGGTIWVFVVNILINEIISNRIKDQHPVRKQLITVCLLILIPVSWSWFRYHGYKESLDPVNIAVIQPNIDPYNEKFSGMSSEEQLERILKLATEVTDSSTDYIVAPETALPDGMWEEQMNEQRHILMLQYFQQSFPKAVWVIGAATNKFYPDSNLRSATARKFTQADGYYDSFNTALQLNRDKQIEIHHKSKLVPGVEKMPYPAVFKYLDNFAIDLGGISGSLGMQESPSVFSSGKSSAVIAPVICYESIYGDYLTEYIRKGASLIFIITNDGWWSDTPGYRQHLKYATLRAIECRRSIARSANTGISCFINQRGDILQATQWWQPDAIRSTLNANTAMTFYALHGDYFGRAAGVISVFILSLLIFMRFRNR